MYYEYFFIEKNRSYLENIHLSWYLCLIDSSLQAEPQQENESQSKGTCAVACKSWADSGFFVVLQSNVHTSI